MANRRKSSGTSPAKRARRGKAPVNRLDPAEQVYQQISEAILEQRLRPGTKLGEQSLSEIFGVNRPIVRRALMRLSYENLVEVRPHRGAFVASPTPEEARQVFEARRVVEDWIVRRCAERADTDALARLRRQADVEAQTAAEGARVRWVRLSGEFHLELARMAGNDRLGRFLEDLVAQTSLIISLYGNAADSVCCNDDHSRIVAAIAAGDGEAAADLTRAHLEACENALRFDGEQEPEDLRAIFLQEEGRPAAG